MFNKITIIGNLGRDPEMRYTPSGSPVTTFSVATNRRYTTQDGETRDETEWFRVSAWNRLAENTNQYLRKGSLVYVEGRFNSRMYQGNDGQMRVSNEVTANEIKFLSTRAQDEGGEFGGGYRSAGDFGDYSPGGGGAFGGPSDAPTTDDIPF